jgi:hypothetical protein
MWLARSKALAWAWVLLGGSTVGVLAFAPSQKEPAQPDVPVAQVVGPAPPAVKEGRVTATRPEVSRVLHVAEGVVTSVAFGPESRIAAGYYVGGAGVGGGVVVFDARGERLRLAPLAVKEGVVTGVAFGPEGRIAAGYYVGGAGVGGGGVVVFDARGERLRPAPLAVNDARGERLRPAPLAVKEGWVTGVAFSLEGRIAAGYGNRVVGGVVVFDAP